MSVQDEAVHWHVLRDRRELTAAEAQAFEDWLRDPSHAAAYEAVVRVWSVVNPSTSNARLERLRQEALALAPPRARTWQRLALAASLIGVLVVGALILLARESPISHQVPAVASSARTTQRDYVTAKGERREIELPDGSTLSLNTDTAVEVEYSQARRLVHLRRGQAIFSVAHDAGRPFVVHAADRRVQATGTLFDVYLAQDRLQVVLAEGEVIVSGMDAASAGTSPVRLAPGQAFVSRAGMADEVRAADVHRAFRWRDGFVEFNDETLAAAVAEMNRYSDHPATVLDERAAALRISGVFRTDRPEEFLSVIRELLPVDVRVSPDGRAEIAGL